MGVPKFYRWLSERYPCLSEVISDAQIPEFDNLYLDMNGIIHGCSHPNDEDVTFRISEEQIFQDIFKYIEKLFRLIKPQKVFFMAVDGVAPRAKMNQQRARRFKSAKDADALVAKAKSMGELIPDEKRFDSNCITPGTHFMTELHKRLGDWVQHKVNTDPSWRGLRIYLSGHDCPGEGEHKIMDFIRTERTVPGYDPNTRHCMYGLDADLIMLGICSHEPHFSLLREEVKFNRPMRHPKGKDGKKAPPPKKTDADTITFHLLHLSLLREYLAWEFIAVKDSLSFEYDMERIIDDWVLMGFLIGNDFIPHLPHVHIHDDALPLLYKTYMEVLPTLDGYINENGVLNLARFQAFLVTFSKNDRNSFLLSMEDEEFMRAKRLPREGEDTAEQEGTFVHFEDTDMSSSDEAEALEASGLEKESASAATSSTRQRVRSEDSAAFKSSDEDEEDEPPSQRGGPSHGVLADGGIESAEDALARLDEDDDAEDEFCEQLAALQFKDLDEKEFENNVDMCWSRRINNDFKRHKKQYYDEKMSFGNISKGQLKEQAEGYVRAIQWVLHYYYHGCCSWNWYFKHHYAPYISDVIDFTGMEMGFEMSAPFRPFDQLLAVLPAASAESLPLPLRSLMCDMSSPIHDFYPTDFRTDLNGKKNDWEAVVLIPFINESRLLEAIKGKESFLSAEDKKRNEPGPHILFTTLQTPENGNWCRRTAVDKDEFRIPREKVIQGLLPNVKMDVFFPGFPTMKHLPHKGDLLDLRVKVFSMPSRKPSMQLSILPRIDLQRDMLEIAADLLGTEVCVEWPVLKIALMAEIWTKDGIYRKEEGEDGEITFTPLEPEELRQFTDFRRGTKTYLLERYAIEPGEIKALARVRKLLGTSHVVEDGKVRPIRQWAALEASRSVPLQLVCVGVLVDENIAWGEMTVAEAFPVNSKVFVMEPSWAGFGYASLVKEVTHPGTPECRVIVQVAIPSEPDLRALRSEPIKFSLPWYDAYNMARQTGVDRGLLARLTGTVFLIEGTQEEADQNPGERPPKLNIGLNLKLSKMNQETPDYARRKSESGYWEYSLLTMRVLTEYRNTFRDLFAYLEKNNAMEDVYYAGDIWPNEARRTDRMAELRAYLEALPCFGAERQTGGERYADSMAISYIEAQLASLSTQMKFQKSSALPARIFRPALHSVGSKVRPDPDATYWLYDRVTYCLDGTPVPFGLTGTIVGIKGADHVDVLFDKDFPTGVKIRSNRPACARVPRSGLVNITYAKERKIARAPATTSRGPRQPVAAPPPRQSAWEERREPAGSDSRKDRKASESTPSTSRAAKEKGGSKESPAVEKLMRDMQAAQTASGISVNDNSKLSKKQKTKEAEELLNFLLGGDHKEASEGGENPKKKDAKKEKGGEKKEEQDKKEETREESVVEASAQEEHDDRGKEAGAALLATLMTAVAEHAEESAQAASAPKPVTAEEKEKQDEETASGNAQSRRRNRRERRAAQKAEAAVKYEPAEAVKKKEEEEREEIVVEAADTAAPRPKTPPSSKDFLKLLGLAKETPKKEEDEVAPVRAEEKKEEEEKEEEEKEEEAKSEETDDKATTKERKKPRWSDEEKEAAAAKRKEEEEKKRIESERESQDAPPPQRSQPQGQHGQQGQQSRNQPHHPSTFVRGGGGRGHPVFRGYQGNAGRGGFVTQLDAAPGMRGYGAPPPPMHQGPRVGGGNFFPGPPPPPGGRPGLPPMGFGPPMGQRPSFDRGMRGGRGGGRYMHPEEYVKDKVTDLTPSSVARPGGGAKNRGGARGRGARGGGPGTVTLMKRGSTSGEADAGQSSEAAQPSPPGVSQGGEGGGGASAPSTAPKQRKTRIGAKLGGK